MTHYAARPRSRTVKIALTVLIVTGSVLLSIWAWWPAVDCDGVVVRGAFQMVCIEDKP